MHWCANGFLGASMTSDKIVEAVEIATTELKALEAYGGNWKYVPEGQFIQSKGLVVDNICRLRGWGHLTGGGALNLSHEEAVALQDALGSLIAKLPQMVAALQQNQQQNEVGDV